MAKWQKRTKEEIEQEVQQMTEKSLTYIQNHTKTIEDQLELLRFMDRFYEYSFRNQALIQAQFEGAQAVGSFAFFKKMGFSVQRGEKGIRILKPNIFEYIKGENGQCIPLSKATKEQKEKIQTGELTKHSIYSFSPTTVFDITQTNAKPEDYPKLFPNKRFAFSTEKTTDLAALKQSLHHVSEKMQVPIRTPQTSRLGFRELGLAKGVFATSIDGKQKEIVLNPRNTPTEEVATLIHELAHAQLHDRTRQNEPNSYWSTKQVTAQTTNIKELQAEMVSYVVSNHYGIDTKEHAIPYIANWTKNGQMFYEENTEEQVAILGDIQKTCKQFIQEIDQQYEKSLVKTNEQEKTQAPSSTRKEPAPTAKKMAQGLGR